MTALALCAATFGGCVVPTPPIGIGMVDHVTIDALKPGMTRLDVLMLLGDPVNRIGSDRFFVYRWDEAHAAVLVGGYMAGYAIPIEDRNALAIEFTSEHKVAKVQRFNRWKFSDDGLLERDLRSFTGVTDDVAALTTATEPGIAAWQEPPSVQDAPVTLFEGAALWHPEWRATPSAPGPPPQGIAGRIVVSGDGVVFHERAGTSGVEVPYRIGRDEMLRVDCAPPRMVIVRIRGGNEPFTILRADGAASDGALTDVALTERVCRLVRDSLVRGVR